MSLIAATLPAKVQLPTHVRNKLWQVSGAMQSSLHHFFFWQPVHCGMSAGQERACKAHVGSNCSVQPQTGAVFILTYCVETSTRQVDTNSEMPGELLL